MKLLIKKLLKEGLVGVPEFTITDKVGNDYPVNIVNRENGKFIFKVFNGDNKEDGYLDDRQKELLSFMISPDKWSDFFTIDDIVINHTIRRKGLYSSLIVAVTRFVQKEGGTGLLSHHWGRNVDSEAFWGAFIKNSNKYGIKITPHSRNGRSYYIT